MGKWKRTNMFGEEFDTGSNNSNSSSSDDELPPYDYMADITPTRAASTSVTWEPEPIGIPTTSYCGKPAVLKTQIIGLLTGQKFYSCSGDIRDGDCHIYKQLSDAFLEEITLTKTKYGEIEDRLVQMLGQIDEKKKKFEEKVNFCKEHNEKFLESIQKEVNNLNQKYGALPSCKDRIFGDGVGELK
ncbi:unnamed protein product [Arabis nemorensis]|uniref:Uncharacterized protein n=1 Tax=Arabis nemorensis TaxID=586526 RepID=A0A565AVM6_9BRAS|nr:unnamed protein product [Arabis nemorensis]